MSTRITHQADGTARGQTQQNTANSIIDLRKQPARTPKQAEPAKPDCCGQPPVPARQKNAREYLAGRSPGVMQSYAPNAAASPVEGWVEDDETVHRLAHWRPGSGTMQASSPTNHLRLLSQSARFLRGGMRASRPTGIKYHLACIRKKQSF